MPINVPDGRIHRWMSLLADNVPLNAICMPGSHDAGLYQKTGGLAPSAQVITQSTNLFGQLRAGVRFFDLRFFEKGGAVHTGHFLELKPGNADIGGYGESIQAVIRQVNTILTEYASEAVILRFSHIKADIARVVIEAVKDQSAALFCTNVATDLATVPLRAVRGKVIAIFDEKVFGPNGGNFRSQLRGIHTFAKSHDGAADLKMCGEFSNRNVTDDVVQRQFAQMESHLRHNTDHLSQLYWTWTGGNIESHTMAARNEYTNFLLRAMITFYAPNIVQYDFCNDATSKLIIETGNHP